MKKYLIILIAFSFLILPQVAISSIGKLYDAPRYLCLSYSIATGNGYRFIFDPHNRPCFYNNFLFPYMIAPVIKLKGINIFPLKLVMIILSFIAVILFRKWTETSGDEKIMSYYLPALFVSSGLFIEFSDKILTEIPFIIFLLLSFLLFEAWRKKRKITNLIALALSIYCAIFTRIPGIAVLVALLIYSLIKKDRKLLATVVAIFIIATITITIIQGRAYPQDRFYHIRYLLYKNPFEPQKGFIVSGGDVLERVIGNFKFYAFNIGSTCIQFPHKPLWLSLLTLGLILAGILKWPSSTRIFYLGFSGIYLLYFIIWPWQDIRFIFPLYPIIIVAFFTGLNSFWKRFPTFWQRTFLMLIMALNFYGGYDKLLRKLTIENIYPPQLREFIELGKWCKENLPEEAVILSSNPSLIYLLSFKKGVFIIYSQDKKKITDYLKNNRVNYILGDRYNMEMRKYIYPWIYANRNNLRIKKVNGATVLLEID